MFATVTVKAKARAVLFAAFMLFFSVGAYANIGPASSLARVTEWKELIQRGKMLDEASKIMMVNIWFNDNLRFGSDMDVWGVNDYWATPMETVSKGVGDCEDFAVAKFFTLIEMGVSPSSLRLVYGYLQDNARSKPHLTLAYIGNASLNPVALDNNSSLLREFGPGFVSVFSFNKTGVYFGLTDQKSKSHLGRWDRLLRKVETGIFS